MSIRSIPIFPANLATYEENLSFRAPKTPLLDAQTRYDVIGSFQHIFSFSTLRIFYVKMANSEGGGLHILSWETTLMTTQMIMHERANL